ncbi:PRC-barrel domain-containing protein [Hyphomonas sp.]|uniref:PRC-barrel domain-containing protein n=1 Tax=Hyphomonas sp. TaxID=87 RepID=UPI00391CC454
MKSLLVTAGALALLMSAAACDSSETADLDNGQTTDVAEIDTSMNGNTSTTGETSMTGASGLGDASTARYTLASGEIEASDLIGAPVHNAAGEEIATVSDIWLGQDGAAPMLVLRDGGVAGVGGELRTIAYTAGTITPDPEDMDGEPDVFVKLTEASLENMPEFEQAANNDFRLASEMIGSTVSVSHNGESARINDLILSETGQARYAVIAADVAATDQILVEASSIAVAEGDADGGLTLDVTAAAFTAAPAYPQD